MTLIRKFKEGRYQYSVTEGRATNNYSDFEELVYQAPKEDYLWASELKLAVKTMVENDHNAAEFGVNRTFVISKLL